jgi:hypothetical protein
MTVQVEVWPINVTSASDSSAHVGIQYAVSLSVEIYFLIIRTSFDAENEIS